TEFDNTNWHRSAGMVCKGYFLHDRGTYCLSPEIQACGTQGHGFPGSAQVNNMRTGGIAAVNCYCPIARPSLFGSEGNREATTRLRLDSLPTILSLLELPNFLNAQNSQGRVPFVSQRHRCGR